MQLHIWQDNTLLGGADNAPDQAVLANDNETVTFTLSLHAYEGNLRFKVKNMSSTSFGNTASLTATVPYQPPSLDGYSTDDTANNSGILFGSNRVTSLTITQVRKYDASGNMVTENSRQVFPAANASSNPTP